MSLANKITIARALLIAPTVACLLMGYRTTALILFGLACAGDVVDGMVARARNEITTWGKVLDPAADKALYVALFCSLYVMDEVSTLAFVLFLAPQVALGLGAIVLRFGEKRAVQSARITGKAASFVSFIALAFLIVKWPAALPILYAAIALTYIASLDYLRGALRIQSSDS
ncbi:MAG: CDP-alcohol phosphatidyltransferase family protein [Candidatus Atribacteria bacterium]|nr:MAG: CDP-alcohol phosphatidyltransferase family protein [Candidatus Atribacteria bacterium]